MEWKTRVTELLDIKYPIIQGGLAYLAYADLMCGCIKCGGTWTDYSYELRFA